MKITKLKIALLAVVVVSAFAFQNCGGLHGIGGSDLSSQSSENSQSQLNAIEEQAQKAFRDPGTTAEELKQTIQSLQKLLQELQAMAGAKGLSPDLKAVLDKLIQQITDDIAQLQQLLNGLNAGGCIFNGKGVASGSTVTAFESESVPEGQSCKQETRMCTNGQLSGSYKFASCSAPGGALTATYSPNPAHTGDRITITASGGTPPYSYKLVSGAGTLNGNVYLAPANPEVTDIAVTDKAGGLFKLSVSIVAMQLACRMTTIDSYVWTESGKGCPAQPFKASLESSLQACAQFCAAQGDGYCDYYNPTFSGWCASINAKNCLFIDKSAPNLMRVTSRGWPTFRASGACGNAPDVSTLPAVF